MSDEKDKRIAELEAENAKLGMFWQTIGFPFSARYLRIAENERLRVAFEKLEKDCNPDPYEDSWDAGQRNVVEQLRAAMEGKDE